MIVADASALLEMLWARPAGAVLRARLREPGQVLHVPFLTDLEVASSLRSVAAAAAAAALAGGVLARYRSLRLRRHAHEPLLDRIWELRHNLSVYDATYVALAERLGAPLVTCDRKLARAPGVKTRIELIAAPLS